MRRSRPGGGIGLVFMVGRIGRVANKERGGQRHCQRMAEMDGWEVKGGREW